MVFIFYFSLGLVEGKNGVGDICRSVQVNKVFWKVLNFRGFCLQKFMSDDYFVGMFNVVENVF